MPKFKTLSPGPEEVHFQEYQFDEYLGVSPGITKGLDLTKQESHDTITSTVCRELKLIFDSVRQEKREFAKLRKWIQESES